MLARRPGVRSAVAVTGLGLFGCSGLFGPDPARLAALDQALADVPPQQAVNLFVRGSVEAGSVRFGCAEGMDAAVGLDDPAMRTTLLAAAFEDWTALCPSPCVGDLAPLAPLAPADRSAAAVAKCDAAGPDPVFGGPLAGLRPAMPALDYLAVRALAEIASDVVPTFATHHPKLAVGLVLMNAPTEVEPTASFTVVSDRPLGESEFQPLREAVQACGPEAVLAHRAVIDPEGRVAGLAGPTEPACVTEALQGLAVPPAPDGAYTVVDLLWKPDPWTPAPAPSSGSPSPSRPPAARPSVAGPLQASVVQRVVRAHLGKLRYCYEKQLAVRPSLSGRVEILFVIAPDGSVSRASTVSNTLRSSEIEGCLEGAFRAMVFPATSSEVTVSWPMTFTPG